QSRESSVLVVASPTKLASTIPPAPPELLRRPSAGVTPHAPAEQALLPSHMPVERRFILRIRPPLPPSHLPGSKNAHFLGPNWLIWRQCWIW
uniref:Uncharacterized protein n=1 Tax=Triticum urartu TaxID=4572 RepID=A0A8R7UCR1_TRIUA